MNTLEFRKVSKRFRKVVIADQMDLAIRENTFSVIFGAPASGKSTLLRLITGLERPDQGDILINGQVVTHLEPGKRNIGYVPQSFALYPHYSVFDNIAYPLQLLGVSKQDYTPIVHAAAEKLQITHLLTKRPDQCSGGEKQRVAIARGIVKDTKIFMLDDPLTGLDFKLRERLFDDLRVMRDELQATFIYTTSDPLEALMLAEDIHVYEAGKIIESGEIATVYRRPQHIGTMRLLGFPNTNLINAQLQPDGRVSSAIGDFHVHLTAPDVGTQVAVAVRPQHIEINPNTTAGKVVFSAMVNLVEDLGGELHIYLDANGQAMEAIQPHHATDILTEGGAQVGIAAEHLQIYDPRSSRLVGQGA